MKRITTAELQTAAKPANTFTFFKFEDISGLIMILFIIHEILNLKYNSITVYMNWNLFLKIKNFWPMGKGKV